MVTNLHYRTAHVRAAFGAVLVGVTVNLPPAQATLVGTLESSTATATFNFSYGLSRCFIRASWTQ